jgi:pimeloyl-ACP methyl ester carboxylesterase
MTVLQPSAERSIEVSDEVTLCYEAFGDPAHPPLLLVMGLGMQMVAWHEDFCGDLAAEGFFVVRFDNLDAGRSSSAHGPPPSLTQLVTRRFSRHQYTLEDMAGDAAGLLRELKAEPAHVVGASMGGMIAQSLAARHPESVRSLTSIMSSTGNRFRGQPALGVYRHLLAQAPTEREAFIDHSSKLFALIGSPGFPKDPEEVRERAGRSFDRGLNRAGTGRQMAAILKSGDRTRDLRRITAPTLVIHGTADRLVAPSGGRATAAAIPGADLMVIDGMGHDLPRALWPRIIAAVAERARRADGALQTA